MGTTKNINFRKNNSGHSSTLPKCSALPREKYKNSPKNKSREKKYYYKRMLIWKLHSNYFRKSSENWKKREFENLNHLVGSS
jgi:hypothetical protein